MYRADSLDDRTERILRLKEFERSNKSRMNTVSGIMGYAQYKNEDVNNKFARHDSVEDEDEFTDDTAQENQTREFKNSFKFRLIFCVLLFGLIVYDRFWLHMLPPKIYQDAGKEIRYDYSDGIIDFINEFPYTLEYEETGAK